MSVNKYLEAKSHKLSVGMRFKMRFEGDEVPERRYICCSGPFFLVVFPGYLLIYLFPQFDRFSGTIVGVNDTSSSSWENSEWRSLKVKFLSILTIYLTLRPW